MYRSSGVGEFTSRSADRIAPAGCSLTFYATIGNVFVVPIRINSFFFSLMNIKSVTRHIRRTLTPGSMQERDVAADSHT